MRGAGISVSGGDGTENDAAWRRELLDAYAELDILGLVAGVRVEVVWSAVVELVTLAELAAYYDAEGQCGDTGGDPTYVAQKGASFAAGAAHGVLNLVPKFAQRARELHGCIITQPREDCESGSGKGNSGRAESERVGRGYSLLLDAAGAGAGVGAAAGLAESVVDGALSVEGAAGVSLLPEEGLTEP